MVEKLGEFIHGATYSLDCFYYEIYKSIIVDSLIAAKERGVRIRIITDSTYYYKLGVQRLISNGIPVIHEGVGANSTDHIMHNKFIVRDFGDSDPSKDFVWTGSFNAGDYLHVDNVVTIRSTELADAYTKEFNQRWGRSSISYLIYSFTRYDLRDTLISLHNHGISVRGVHEDVDTAYVITGSMNWSNNGTSYNDKNLLIIRNSSSVLRQCEVPSWEPCDI